MRDLWQTTQQAPTGTSGVVALSKAFEKQRHKKPNGTSNKNSRSRKILKEGTNHNTRREWKVLHGFRKWFNGVLLTQM